MTATVGKLFDWRLGTAAAPSTLVDLSEKVKSAGFDIERDLLEANRFNNNGARSNEKGLYGATFPVTFFYEPAVHTQLLNALLADNTVNIQFGPVSSASGKPKYTGAVHISNVSNPVEVNTMMELTAKELFLLFTFFSFFIFGFLMIFSAKVTGNTGN